MPLVSVIIPVYNSEKYLKECLDSVVNQSFKDFEVLLINDGSTDNSGQICDEYAAKDNRFRVFQKENGGVSSARNLGLENAKGEWIAFVDSDDKVEKDYLLDLKNGLINDKIGLVIHSFKKVNGDTVNNYKIENGIVKVDNLEELFEKRNINNFGYPVSKLFKKEIIKKNNLKFPLELTIAEDISFLLNYIPKSNKINFQEKYNYNYLIRSNSLTTTKKHYTKNWDRYLYNKDDLRKNYGNIIEDSLIKHFHGKLIDSLGMRLFTIFSDLYLSDIKQKERIQFLKTLDNLDLEIMKSYSVNFSFFLKLCFQLLYSKKIYLADILLKSAFIYVGFRNKIK